PVELQHDIGHRGIVDAHAGARRFFNHGAAPLTPLSAGAAARGASSTCRCGPTIFAAAAGKGGEQEKKWSASADAGSAPGGTCKSRLLHWRRLLVGRASQNQGNRWDST